MSLNRKRKQNDLEKLFDLDPEERIKEEKEQKEREKKEKSITPEKAEKIRKKKSFFRKLLVIGLPIVVAIVAVVLIISYKVNNSGYRLQIKNTISVVVAEDAEGFCNNLSELSYHGMTYEQYLPARYLTVKSMVESYVDSLEDTSGKIESTKFKVINSEKLSKSEVSDLISSSVAEGTEPTITADDIDEIRRVDIKLIVNGSKFVTTYMLYNIYLVNEKGQWKTYIDISQIDFEQISQDFPK